MVYELWSQLVQQREASNTLTSKSITKHAGKKKYYVRIRTYKKVSGKNYYSAWSKSKTVKTKQ